MGGSRTCTSALKDTELLDASKSPSVMLVCGCILEAEAACFVKNGFVKNSNRETDEVRVEQKIALICIKKYTQAREVVCFLSVTVSPIVVTLNHIDMIASENYSRFVGCSFKI